MMRICMASRITTGTMSPTMMSTTGTHSPIMTITTATTLMNTSTSMLTRTTRSMAQT